MSNAKVFAIQGSQMNTTDYTDPYATHMDQKQSSHTDEHINPKVFHDGLLFNRFLRKVYVHWSNQV